MKTKKKLIRRKKSRNKRNKSGGAEEVGHAVAEVEVKELKRKRNRDTEGNVTSAKKTKGLFRANNKNDAMILMENLYNQCFTTEEINHRALDKLIEDELLVKVKNNDEFYDSIFKINNKIKSDAAEEAKVVEEDAKKLYSDKVDIFVGNIFRFQEIPKEKHFMKECPFGEDCNRKNILHKLTHKFLHKASFIAESFLLLRKKYLENESG